MMPKRVLVTGSDGFIGSHLVEALVRESYTVRAFVQYNSFSSWGWLGHAAAGVRGELWVVAGDVRDSYMMDSAVQGCDTVLHLAALIAIPFSYQAPELYVATNVTGTLKVLQASRRHEIDRVVCTSTSEVYGTAQFVPITEEHPLNAGVMEAEVEIVPDPERLRPESSEVERLFAGVDAARAAFGWTPEFGGRDGFARGLAETADWFREPANLAAYKIDQYNV